MNIDYTLYLVTDRALMRSSKITNAVEQAILGGCTMVQLREKEISSLEFFNLAAEVKAMTDRYEIPLIINDRIDIALSVQAAGVHIGQQDIPAHAVRKIIGDAMLLGVSCASVQEAIQAQSEGADYLGIGAMFATNTKHDACNVSIETLKRIKRSVRVPVIAIGGINHKNVSLLKTDDLDGIAVVSAILSQPDIRQAASQLKYLFQQGCER